MKDRRVTDTNMTEMMKIFTDHEAVDFAFQEKINRVLFGDKETNETGMKEKVDEIHALLIQAQNVRGFFGGVRGLVTWFVVIGAAIALFKGWLAGLFAYITMR